jgi:hypothetical protein
MTILETIRKIIQERKSVSAFLIENINLWSILRTVYPDVSAGTYERHVIENDENIEVALIIWGIGANTGFHGHPDIECWFSVFEGSGLIEDLPQGISNKICGGYRAGITDQHSIRTLERAASIHIYCKSFYL